MEEEGGVALAAMATEEEQLSGVCVSSPQGDPNRELESPSGTTLVTGVGGCTMATTGGLLCKGGNNVGACSSTGLGAK